MKSCAFLNMTKELTFWPFRVGSEDLIQNMMCCTLCKHCYLKLTWQSLYLMPLKDWWLHERAIMFAQNFEKWWCRSINDKLLIAYLQRMIFQFSMLFFIFYFSLLFLIVFLITRWEVGTWHWECFWNNLFFILAHDVKFNIQYSFVINL